MPEVFHTISDNRMIMTRTCRVSSPFRKTKLLGISAYFNHGQGTSFVSCIYYIGILRTQTHRSLLLDGNCIICHARLLILYHTCTVLWILLPYIFCGGHQEGVCRDFHDIVLRYQSVMALE